MESIKELRARNGAFLLLGWLATAAVGCEPTERPLVDVNALGPAAAGAGGTAAGTQVVSTDPTMESSAEDPTANVDDLAAGEVDDATREADADAGVVGADGGASCPGCFIGGECFAADAVLTENQCQICDPARDTLGWSNNDGVACDDGLFCTVDDVCRAGVCGGTARNCEDGVACNGISTCLEESDSCSPPVSQCGNNAVCDTATDSCQSTCNGCVINGVCVAGGTEAPGNPCQVCDPSRSSVAYSIIAGKSCGASATDCSGQDTCDAQGRCQPNHLPSNTPCGNPSSGACDQSDTCDGNGNCQQRTASNGTPCDDGAFCTVGDQCQGGRCVSGGNRSCGANQTCSNASNSCLCQGCQVGNTCFTAGATNPNNSCQVCDPNRSATAFSVNAGASCGAGPTECSGQDTCNNQGQCVPNNLTDGGRCNSAPGGTCRGGQCVGCTGCTIGNSCITAGTTNASNACQICDPNRSTTAFSVNSGASCGAGPTECSGQDTCNNQGQCISNDFTNRSCTSVAGGSCQNGTCVAPAPTLPPVNCASRIPPRPSTEPAVANVGGSQPAPTGGVITEGIYLKRESRFYAGSFVPNSIGNDAIQLQAGTFIRRENTPIGATAPVETITAGTFTATGTTLVLNLSTCVNGSPSGSLQQSFGYDASSFGTTATVQIHRNGITDVFDLLDPRDFF